MARLLVLTSLAILASGCSRQPTRVPVTGRVIMDGQPLANATVVFQCSDGTPYAASAQTDTHGRFRLTTLETDGAIPGNYRVMICKYAKDDREQILPEDYMFEAEAMSYNEDEVIVPPIPAQLVPDIYAVYHTTPLQYDVEWNASNDFDISILKSD